jgi:hypothetical protein
MVTFFSSLLTTDMQTSKYLAARYLSAPEFFSSGGGWLNMKSSRVQVENLKIYSFSLWFRDKRGGGGDVRKTGSEREIYT